MLSLRSSITYLYTLPPAAPGCRFAERGRATGIVARTVIHKNTATAAQQRYLAYRSSRDCFGAR